MTIEGVAAYPLYWPDGWARRKSSWRPHANYKVSFVKARDDVLRSLRLMDVAKRDRIISTNIPLRRDGLPYANLREPEDPGVAVYWTEYRWQDGARKATPRVVACDHWKTVRDNLRAIGLTLEALRTIKRAGATELIDRAFLGFKALPANAGDALTRPWFVVLGVTQRATKTQIDEAFRGLLLTKHPDHGGTDAEFLELNNARETGLRQAGSAR